MSKVQDFKKYLAKDNPLTGKLYFGSFDHEPDQGFESAVKTLEVKIANAINNPSVIGQLWTKSGFNYKADLNDVINSVNIITKSQATLDSLGPYEDHQMLDRPTAVNFQNTPPDYLEEVDPAQSQRQGVLDQSIPEDILENQDERFLKLIEILNN